MKENKILILEDDIIVGIDLQEVLIANGYNTLLVHNYETALSQAKIFKPNLAICDINLGKGLTGIDFVKDVYIILPKLEIIYVTAFSNKQMMDDVATTNSLNYIVKPWNEEQIKVSVKMAFNYIEKKFIFGITEISSTNFCFIGLEKKMIENNSIEIYKLYYGIGR